MNAGAIAPNTATSSVTREALRADHAAESFAAAVRAAISAFAGSESSPGRASSLLAPAGRNDAPNQRRDERPGTPGAVRGAARDRNDDGPSSNEPAGPPPADSGLTPEAAAALLLVTPQEPKALSRPVVESPLHADAPNPEGPDDSAGTSRRNLASRAHSPEANEHGSANAGAGTDESTELKRQPDSSRVAPLQTPTVQSSPEAEPGPQVRDFNGADQQRGAGSRGTNTQNSGAASASGQVASTSVPGTPSKGEASGIRGPIGPAQVGAIGVARTALGTRGSAGALPTRSGGGLVRTPDEGLEGQVARGLAAALRQKSGSITLRLSPESLGQVRIDLSVRGDQVRARLVAAEQGARDLLRRDADALRGALESRGLKVEHLEVLSREQDAAGSPLHRAQEAHAETSQPGWTPGGSPDGTDRGGRQSGRDGSEDRPSNRARLPNADSFEGVESPGFVRDGELLRLDAIA